MGFDEESVLKSELDINKTLISRKENAREYLKDHLKNPKDLTLIN